MTWFKNNIRTETMITIAIIIAGFIATNAVKSYEIKELKVHEIVQDGRITLNTTHRIVADAQPAFTPRTEFDVVKTDITEIKAGQKEVIRILLEMKK